MADFDASYDGTPPWDIGVPQPAFAALVPDERLAGRVLDAGCGTGEHALMAAAAGFEATGIDISPKAIRRAQAKAEERGLAARFLVGDALELGGEFDTVLDCGLFHVFDDADRERYVESLRHAVGPGGRLFILCFSDDEPPGWGPRRITQDELRHAFAEGWEVQVIEPTPIRVTIREEPVRGWFVALRRT